MAHDIFLSHSTRDRTFADALCHHLEAIGIRCWIAPRDVPPGGSWRTAIVDALKSKPIMVLLFSSAANESDQVKKELSIADNYKLVVIPVRVENVMPSSDFEYELARRHWLDAFTGHKEQIEEVAQIIKDIVSRQKIQTGGATGADTPEDPVALAMERRASRPEPSAQPAQRAATSKKPLWVGALLAVVLAALGAYFYFEPQLSYYGKELLVYPDKANLRSGPDGSYPIVTVLDHEQVVQSKWIKKSPIGHPWLKIKAQSSGENGYISAKLLMDKNKKLIFTKAVVLDHPSQVRDQPKTDATILSTLNPGIEIDLYGWAGGSEEWYKVSAGALDDSKAVQGYILITDVMLLLPK